MRHGLTAPARHKIKLSNYMETPTHTAPPVALDRLVRRDKGWEQSEIENAELRQYAAHALGLLNKLEYEREEDGKGELVATLDLDWFFHVKRRLEKILISPPNSNDNDNDTDCGVQALSRMGQ